MTISRKHLEIEIEQEEHRDIRAIDTSGLRGMTTTGSAGLMVCDAGMLTLENGKLRL
jgi:hypothetical protein